MKNSKRILSVKIIHQVDMDPDTSYLGEYSNRATSEYAIDRAHSEDCPINTGLASELLSEEDRAECDCGEHGDMSRNEYRYFNPSFNYVDEHGKLADGLTPDEVRKYVRQDYERMESLNRGDWCYLGIRAEAEIQLSNPQDAKTITERLHSIVQTIHSGGLWGIESDSDKSYLESVGQDELSDLKTQLLAIGFSRRAIGQVFKNVEEVSE